MLNKKELKSYYTVEELKTLPTSEIIENIKYFLDEKLNSNTFSEGQIISWNKSIELVKSIFEKDNKNWNIIFEFLIPLSSGKRPDILLINGVTIFLVEVKNKSSYNNANLDQIKGYKLDLEYYHSSAHFFEIKPILLLLEAENLFKKEDDIIILSPENFKRVLLDNYKDYLMINSKSLNNGRFKPVPNITEYAKAVFESKEIENIEKVCFSDSSIINVELNTIVKKTKEKNEHAIVFLVGTPGSGKSALGLKCSFENDGLYVTKNRQFAENLKDELGIISNIKTSHNFLFEYSNKDKEPNFNLVVFDEAQRFWNPDKMKKYFDVDKSESQLIVDLYSKKDWSVLVMLIGRGQEIGWGEGDVHLWNETISKFNTKWTIYGSKKTRRILGYTRKYKFVENEIFDLNNSFRNFKAPHTPFLIDDILDFKGKVNSFQFKKIKGKYKSISENGFKILISRNLDSILDYCKSRYEDSPNAYCFLTSSKANYDKIDDLPYQRDKIVYDYDVSSKLNINTYFKNNGVRSAEDNHLYPLDEYSSIGFELQMPIIVWGLDFLWYKNRWNFEFITYVNYGTELRQNTYRILLTRGRDGVILYFPKTWQFDDSFEFFKELGASVI
jgi:hypothetical protein